MEPKSSQPKLAKSDKFYNSEFYGKLKAPEITLLEGEFGALKADMLTYTDKDAETLGNWDSGCLRNNEHFIGRSYVKLLRTIRPDGKMVIVRNLQHRSANFNSLFLDLVFITGFIAVEHGITNTLEAGGSYTKAILEFLAGFFALHQLWMGTTMYENYFGPEDLLHKFYLLFQMSMVLGMSSLGFFAENKRSSFVFFALASFLNFAFAAFHYTVDPIGVTFIRQEEKSFLCCLPFYIFTLFLDSMFGLADEYILGVFIVILLANKFIMFLFMMRAMKNRDKELTHIFPGMNIEFCKERFGLFMILIFGEIILAIDFDKGATFSNYCGCIFILTLAFSLQTIFFDVENGRSGGHPFRRGGIPFITWMYLHMFLGASILILGKGSKKLLDKVKYDYVELDVFLYYCLGLGLSLATLSLMSMTHKHRSDYRISKQKRNYIRLVLAFIIGVIIPLCESIVTPLSVMGICSLLTSIMTTIDFHGDQKIVIADIEDESEASSSKTDV